MAENLPPPEKQPLLEVNEEDWKYIVQTIREGDKDKKIPERATVTPEFLSGTLGFPEEAAPALFDELIAQHVVSPDKGKLGHNVITPEGFRRIQEKAGRVAVGSVSFGSRSERRELNRKLSHSSNPFSWAEITDGEPSVPEHTTHIQIRKKAPLLKRSPSAAERRFLAQNSAADMRVPHDVEYIKDEEFWPSIVRKVAVVRGLAEKRKSPKSWINTRAILSALPREIDDTVGPQMANDAMEKLLDDGVLGQHEYQQTPRGPMPVYPILLSEAEIFSMYGVEKDEPDPGNGDGPRGRHHRNPRT